jgi:pimeloyl-ACP methyl ester carboxylesterase
VDPVRHRLRRLRIALTSGAVLCAIMACSVGSCNPGAPATQLTLCAVDGAQKSACDATEFSSGHVVTGDFRPQNGSQTIQVRAVVTSTQQTVANMQVAFTITGANPRTVTENTNAGGIATLTYQGTQIGTDTITAAPPSSSTFQVSRPAVVHWLKAQAFIHPVIFLHGINEDANVIANHQEWTSLFEALSMTYDPNFIETFCYDDDKAYADPTQPAHCPAPGYTPACSGSTCVSQSSVDVNAVELAERVIDLHQRSGKLVTLMGYSMGTAISRTLLAGCLNTSTTLDSDHDGDLDVDVCNTARSLVDQVYFLNGVQQGSWLMAVKKGLDAAALAGDGIPPAPVSPFLSVLPALDSAIFGVVKDRMGLDVNQPAETDLTPLSANIVAHNQGTIPPQVKVYTFYGDIQIRLGVTELIYPLAGTTSLPLGDLVLLAQKDDPASLPPWGGASLCGNCAPADSLGFHTSTGGDQFHSWALMDTHDVSITDIIPGIGSTLSGALNSPVSHLNISQPIAQAPGSTVQVEDITHLAGSHTTDMANEIIEILMQRDGIA